MLKILLTYVAFLSANMCFAQNQIFGYNDLQMLMQSKTDAVNSFLTQKKYHIQPGFSSNEVRALNLFGDNDYTDILVTVGSKHNTIQLITTNPAQTESLQRALQNFRSKENKGIVKYQVKDGIVSHVDVKTEKPKNNSNGIYTFLLEN